MSYSLKPCKTCSEEGSKSLIFIELAITAPLWKFQKRAQKKGRDRSFWSGSRALLLFEAFKNVLRRRVKITHLHRAREHCSSLKASKTCSEERSRSLIFVGLASTAPLWKLQNRAQKKAQDRSFSPGLASNAILWSLPKRAQERGQHRSSWSGSRAVVFFD